jgi:hypothetical protein
MYRTLAADKIVETIEKLKARIGERFPGAGLESVCGDFLIVAQTSAARAEALARPNMGLRIAVGVLVAVGLAAQFLAFRYVRVANAELDAAGLIQGLEAAVNLLLLFGAAVWFLINLEARWKREQVLTALHELRSLAHVVDMHQLTKDPTVLLTPETRTASSPAREMNEFQITRYLDYCAEMLALMGKIAALYAEKLRDPDVIDAVNDIENLCANLGRKIWQKIMIIGQLHEGRPGR